MSRSLVWFRNDLRIADNPALHGAFKYSRKPEIIALFFISPSNWKEHDWSPAKVNLALRSLSLLSKKLNSLNIPFLVEECSFKEAPSRIAQICERMNLGAVFANREYEVNEGKRDEAVKKALKERGIELRMSEEQCVVPPHLLKLSNGKPHCVFTPYKNDWIRHLEIHRDLLKEFPAVPKLEPFDHKIPQIDVFECKAYEITDENFKSLIESTWAAGEDGAIARLNEFATGQIQKYKELRDFPAIDGTSRLSPYLALGLVSAKHCLNVALDANNGKFKGGNENIAHWISEICWREFFRSILCNFPRVSKSQPFNLDSKRLKWRFDEVEFRAWKEGKTGYPVVDAGMRELKATGYISNRLRMIAASFLTKDLLMNWQLGEAHFMSHLIDGDLASNNGGWQWAASTGVDTRSYLRHFNPKLQSEKFDSDGSYIRRWVPELRHLDSKRIHDPYSFLSPGEFAKLNYPKPIVNHRFAQQRAIEAFKEMLGK